MNRSQRRWHRELDDDPLAGLVNLFDLWIVVVVALVLVLAQSSANHKSELSGTNLNESLLAVPIPSFQETDNKLTGKGTRLGTAYRLENGEVVYTPD